MTKAGGFAASPAFSRGQQIGPTFRDPPFRPCRDHPLFRPHRAGAINSLAVDPLFRSGSGPTNRRPRRYPASPPRRQGLDPAAISTPPAGPLPVPTLRARPAGPIPRSPPPTAIRAHRTAPPGRSCQHLSAGATRPQIRSWHILVRNPSLPAGVSWRPRPAGALPSLPCHDFPSRHPDLAGAAATSYAAIP